MAYPCVTLGTIDHILLFFDHILLEDSLPLTSMMLYSFLSGCWSEIILRLQETKQKEEINTRISVGVSMGGNPRTQ